MWDTARRGQRCSPESITLSDPRLPAMNRSLHHFGAFVGRHPTIGAVHVGDCHRPRIVGGGQISDRRAKRHLRSLRQSVERRDRGAAVRVQQPLPRAAHRRRLEPALDDRRQPASAMGRTGCEDLARAAGGQGGRGVRRPPQSAAALAERPRNHSLGGAQGDRRAGTAARGADRAVGARAVAGTINGARSAIARCRDRRPGGRYDINTRARRAAITPRSGRCRSPSRYFSSRSAR